VVSKRKRWKGWRVKEKGRSHGERGKACARKVHLGLSGSAKGMHVKKSEGTPIFGGMEEIKRSGDEKKRSLALRGKRIN